MGLNRCALSTAEQEEPGYYVAQTKFSAKSWKPDEAHNRYPIAIAESFPDLSLGVRVDVGRWA